jgi:hypothetical protein
MQYRTGRGGWIFQEGAEKQAVVKCSALPSRCAIATLGGDPLAVIIVQVEVACQFFAGKGVYVWIAAVPVAYRKGS